ncbi:MAG: DUF58 domain-containing protein [Betaproteobacteria bacterium]
MNSDANRHASIGVAGSQPLISPSIRERIGDWIFPPKGPEAGPIVLGQRRVYILPTGGGLMFAVTLLLMLIGSINYNLSLGYVLAFLLAGNGVVSMLHTWRNLARIALRPGKASPVFAGDLAGFRVQTENSSSFPRTSLAIQLPGREPQFFDIAGGGSAGVEVRTPAASRGILHPPRFRIFTTYPLGLFYAWAIFDLDMYCLVYPAPETGNVALPTSQTTDGQGMATANGEDDFAGLRTFHPGDSPRRIAWKVFARSEVFLSKQFSGSGTGQLWLDFADLPNQLGVEEKLSRLTRWVIESDAAGLRYGLRLPRNQFEPDAGALHRDRCLQALALFKT